MLSWMLSLVANRMLYTREVTRDKSFLLYFCTPPLPFSVQRAHLFIPLVLFVFVCFCLFTFFHVPFAKDG